MEELQTDTLSDYNKSQTPEKSQVNDTEASLLNGCDDLDPLDLMDTCETASIGSNSDVWKGSDSEEQINDDLLNTSAPCDKDTSQQVVEPPTLDNSTTNVENTELTKETSTEKENVTISSEETETPDTALQDNITEKETIESEKDTIESETNVQETVENETNVQETEKEIIEDKSNVQETEKEIIEDESNVQETEKQTIDAENDVQEAEKEETASNKNGKDSLLIQALMNGQAMSPKEGESQNKSNDDVFIVNDDDEVDSSNKCTNGKEMEGSVVVNQNNNDNSAEINYDDEDDDFDPSLLCPEVSMDVDDNPVITSNGCAPSTSDDVDEVDLAPYLDQITGAEISFNLTPEEQEARKRLYRSTNPVQLTRLHCTACNLHLGSALEVQSNRYVHPLLKVLICKGCYNFYTSGDFEKDEDGSELYCRWCGQGGQVLCCSKCEYVFCKRCIRTNFGRKKMQQIRDSDCWDCFRCNLSQISNQRIQCFEFFEYIRRELRKGPLLQNSESWTHDYSKCCSVKRKLLNENGEEVKKVKRKKTMEDPEYDPLTDRQPLVPVLPRLVPMPNRPPMGMMNPPIRILPNMHHDNDIEFVRQIPAPNVTLMNMSRPIFRPIMSTMEPAPTFPPTLLRICSQPVPPLAPAMRPNPMALTARPQPPPNPNSAMKHEWFEKTVRAAARVNSHLSYTLTQLNKAQSQAASVEELAVVHNKLQEILSSSINSLIQIRKNLRTEFISGIKTVRLPSKKIDSFAGDDDVIFVSAPPTMMPPMPSTSFVSLAPPKPVEPTVKVGLNSCKGLLKVRSISELQNVPSECITIPDEVVAPVAKGNEGREGEDCQILSEVPNDVEKIRRDLLGQIEGLDEVAVKRMLSVKVNLQRDDLVKLQGKLRKEL